jgi:heme oxygenase (mycobilin-producing)
MIRVVLEHKAKDRECALKLIEGIELVRKEARRRHGFLEGSTLVDVNNPCHVVVVSTWETLNDWRAWDNSRIRQDMLPLIEDYLAEPYTAVSITENVIWSEEIAHVS